MEHAPYHTHLSREELRTKISNSVIKTMLIMYADLTRPRPHTPSDEASVCNINIETRAGTAVL